MIRGRELFRVARPLLAPGAGEAWARSAVNRCYYAAYTETVRYITARGYAWMPGSGGSHIQVWRYLRRGIADGDATRRAERRALAALGSQVKARRVRADYRTTGALGKSEARDAFREAKDLVGRLDRLTA